MRGLWLNRRSIHLRDIVARTSSVKLGLLLTTASSLFSLCLYLVVASAFDSVRIVGVLASLLIPAVTAPPICIVILKVARSLYSAQEEILKAQMELEIKVADRTQELHRANIHLREEIQERKQAEQDLRESITLQQTLLANITVGVIIVDPLTRKIEVVNGAAADMFGVEVERIIGHQCHSFICPSLENSCPVIDLKQEADNSERELVCSDGSRLPILKSVKRIQIHGQEKLLESFVDIAARKRAEEEKIKLETQLLQVQKMESLGTLAGGIAHDFNNLLMGIQGYTSLIMLDLDASHPHHKQLKHIEEQVQSAAGLTRQLLGFARGGKYEMRSININEVIQKTSAMFGRTKKELTIHGKYEGNLWSVKAERGQIEQVLLNLYVNAWHAMPSGGELYLETRNLVVDEIHPALFGMPPGEYIVFSVADTGMGMNEETKKRIFDPFFTTKGMGRGTGLGLAMVYGIVKGHSGFIDVVSKPGQGTTFTLYLPATKEKAFEEKPSIEETFKGSESILLVDDEPSVLAVSKAMLESLGYMVHAVSSGQEAVAFYEEMKDSVSLIVLDMIMPGFSGSQAFERIMALNPSAKVVLSTGYSMDGQAQQIMDKGCRGFIQKPFNLTHLSQKIREVLEN